ncbi:MAG: tail fiber domain-containing protein, partial [Prolixibacteraceae bacterium]|nr:tail fiber domain-containing protein [Prolixibacteraceae bacterium]
INQSINQSITKLLLTLLLMAGFIFTQGQIVVDSNGNVKLASDLNVDKYYGTSRIYPDENNASYLGINNNQFYQIRGQYHYATSTLLTSDKRLKQNFRNIEKPLAKVQQLNGIIFDYIPEASDSIGSAEEKEKKVALKKNKQGFIAQEVKEIVPEAVVYEKESDLYYIDYNAIIPLLVEAMKEQQATIEALETRLEKLESNNPNLKSAGINGSEPNAESLNTPTLAQNIPNPFSNTTRIDIYLPETVKNAILYVYNMQGVQIKSFDINERGATSVTIEGYTLQAGMYLYTLIADGKEVDTKKMILTK